MTRLATEITDDKTVAQQAVLLAGRRVAATWTRGRGTPLRLYLYCHVVAGVLAENRIRSGSKMHRLSEPVARRAMLVLHDLCGVPTAQIAVILEYDPAFVRNVVSLSRG